MPLCDQWFGVIQRCDLKMNFAVVEFKDSKQKLRKIVSIEYIRNADNSPFVPKSAKHFNRDSIYKVKWQEQSTSDGDSDWDGYCESSILCIAGNVPTIISYSLKYFGTGKHSKLGQMSVAARMDDN